MTQLVSSIQERFNEIKLKTISKNNPNMVDKSNKELMEQMANEKMQMSFMKRQM